jgi:hypothetical protein
VFTHLQLHQPQQHHLLQQQILEPRVSVFLFNHGLFFGRLPFALLVLQFRASVSPEVVSAIFVFPSHKNNAYKLRKVYCYFVWERKFLAVRRVGLMTRHEYCFDRPFPVM